MKNENLLPEFEQVIQKYYKNRDFKIVGIVYEKRGDTKIKHVWISLEGDSTIHELRSDSVCIYHTNIDGMKKDIERHSINNVYRDRIRKEQIAAEQEEAEKNKLINAFLDQYEGIQKYSIKKILNTVQGFSGKSMKRKVWAESNYGNCRVDLDRGRIYLLDNSFYEFSQVTKTLAKYVIWLQLTQTN